MSSESFGNSKTLQGKVFRDGPLGKALRDLRRDVDLALSLVEGDVTSAEGDITGVDARVTVLEGIPAGMQVTTITHTHEFASFDDSTSGIINSSLQTLPAHKLSIWEKMVFSVRTGSEPMMLMGISLFFTGDDTPAGVLMPLGPLPGTTNVQSSARLQHPPVPNSSYQYGMQLNHDGTGMGNVAGFDATITIHLLN